MEFSITQNLLIETLNNSRLDRSCWYKFCSLLERWEQESKSIDAKERREIEKKLQQMDKRVRTVHLNTQSKLVWSFARHLLPFKENHLSKNSFRKYACIGQAVTNRENFLFAGNFLTDLKPLCKTTLTSLQYLDVSHMKKIKANLAIANLKNWEVIF